MKEMISVETFFFFSFLVWDRDAGANAESVGGALEANWPNVYKEGISRGAHFFFLITVSRLFSMSPLSFFLGKKIIFLSDNIQNFSTIPSHFSTILSHFST